MRLRPVVGPRSWSAFHVFGVSGFVVAVGLAMALVRQSRLSAARMAVVVVLAVAVFLVLALGAKVLTGRESLTYYHHQLAVLGVAALYLSLVGGPVLAYLDATVLGIGAFLVFGRVGCLMVGCCHGRPHRWGVRYGPEHARAGFPAYLVGAPLFPTQAIESALVVVLVASGTAVVWRDSRPGTALAWYLVAYAVGRFTLEFTRGDPGRVYVGGFSEAQWTSVTLAVAVAIAGRTWWQVLAGGTMVLALVTVAVARARSRVPVHALVRPRHVRELVEALDLVTATGPSAVPAVATTSLGIRISGGRLSTPNGIVTHASLSTDRGPIAPAAARAIGVVLGLLREPGAPMEVAATGDLVHLLYRRHDLAPSGSQNDTDTRPGGRCPAPARAAALH